MIQKKNKKITIKNQSEIETYFKDKSIKLLKNSSLTFINKIEIEPNVIFKEIIILAKKMLLRLIVGLKMLKLITGIK